MKPNGRHNRLGIGFALVYPSLLTWLYFMAFAEFSSAIQQTVYTLGKLIQFAFPAIWVLWVQRQRLQLTRPDRKGLVIAIGFGLAVVAGMLLLFHFVLVPNGIVDAASGPIIEKVEDFGVTSPIAFCLLALFYSLIHSLLEEYYWRWFVFGQLRERCSLSVAMIVSSLGFMAHHVIVLGFYFGWASPITYVFSLSVAVGGLFWAWLYDNTKSLYAPWISHLIVDAGIFFLGYQIVRQSL